MLSLLSSCSFCAPPNRLDRLFDISEEAEAVLGKVGLTRFAVDPEVENPIDGSLLPNLYLSSADTVCRTVDCLLPVGAASDGVLGRGVPGAVLAGVPAGH